MYTLLFAVNTTLPLVVEFKLLFNFEFKSLLWINILLPLVILILFAVKFDFTAVST